MCSHDLPDMYALNLCAVHSGFGHAYQANHLCAHVTTIIYYCNVQLLIIILKTTTECYSTPNSCDGGGIAFPDATQCCGSFQSYADFENDCINCITGGINFICLLL